MRYYLITLLIAALLLLGQPPVYASPTAEDMARVEAATSVLEEVMRVPEQGIPADMLGSARGVAIFPGLIKAGIGIGGSYGRGVLVIRKADGNWSHPSFITLTGGSLGPQIGAESADLILVFKTDRSMQGMENGKLTLGGTASIAAGPVGTTREAATDAQFQAEILSYARSRGLFVGAALQGASLRLDYIANRSFYGISDPLHMQARAVPSSAKRFSCILASYTGGATRVCA